MAFRSLKAASSKATVGSAYGMAPAYPKTQSPEDVAATARFHAFNNLYFLHTAMHGEYSKAFLGDPPLEAMGYKPGDDKLMQAPLDWLGFHYYTRRVISHVTAHAGSDNGGNFGAELVHQGGASGVDPLSLIRVEAPTEGPLTEAGLEIWPQGIHDLVM